ncbi:shootin-1-like [Seriola lalandi dorsalis]|uniref:shootin-1-like n=1 Tax=Seriola lalandi dorsalis TaxID=1841481 RepID=UPI000C6FC46F|nr:shootin-1-like [Seriola lalandi dorsalis]
MLPCSSAAQMEGCAEERDAHMQTECNRLTEERDEAERQLKHIKRVSQMVIEEVSVLQTQLEIEKSCRENAEALATKLNCENRKLKYLSLSSRPCLDELLPSISDCISLEADTDVDADAADAADGSADTFTQYQQQVKELRETVNSLLEEKKNFVCQVHDQQRRIEELTLQSEKDQAEMKELRETVEQQNKTIKRFNRVSMMAAQEYDGMKEQLDLEQSLRVKAETYAHEMLVKQKEANRQSMLLLQSTEPSVQLLKALEDVAAVTKTLEEERLQHQQKVQSLEAQLEQSCVKKQLEALQRQLELLEVEKKESEGRLERSEKKNEELESRVHELQETQKKITMTTSTAPPPPEPGVAPPSRCNPLSSLIAIMRKSSKGSKAAVKAEQPPAAEGVDDVKVKAVNEMMERIKHGVVLRPVKSQDSKRAAVKPPPPICEEKQQESAMDELKGILETVKRSPSRGSQESGPSPPGKKDSELEVILRRRRNKAGEAGSGDEREGQMSHVSSSDSLNGRRTSSDSGKDPEGPGGLLSTPSDPAGSRAGQERRGSGPGPIVARRKSSDTGRESRVGSWQERRSCSSLSERETESPVSNGCVNSVGEDDRNGTKKCVESNGVDHGEPSEDARAAVCGGPVNGGADPEC